MDQYAKFSAANSLFFIRIMIIFEQHREQEWRKFWAQE